MGILSDFFVAAPEQASRYARAIEEEDEGEEIRALLQPRQWKGFTGLEFGTLWAILEGERWDVKKHMLEDAEHHEDGDWCLQRFPSRLVDRLKALDTSRRDAVLEAWAKTDELRCTPSELEPILNDIQRLAAEVREGETSLYLWSCV